ncbi:MAG: T9SS type A sorting domain-containing protein [Saprospiraceae bacterium]|nr:T9SS type A sorting domain-containing protein [Saprospiraceae bacterium]MBK7809837.1 T9SS type A sorting domain-containing protein [Saprospiraceae bacterium]
MPNFRLGPVDGSSCDTLGIDNIPWAWWRYDQDTSRYRCFEFVDLSGYLTEESEPEWYWDLGDGTQSRDTSPIHCFEKDGVYEVCLIVKNKYGSDTLCRTLNVGTSATNDEGKIEIKSDIFPNPASDHFVLNVYDYLPESMYLYLINAQGQTIRRERVFQGSNVIDIEQLPAGVYSVVIYERGAVVKTEKIVVRD